MAAAAAPAAGAAAAAPPPPAPAAAAAPRRARAAALLRPAWTRLSARVALATALFVLGCAAAALAFVAMALPVPDPPANSRILGTCAPTVAEAAALRAASELLLLAASAQVLGAVVTLLVPAPLFAASGKSGLVLGGLTAYRAADVAWMLVACHGHVHGEVSFHYWLFFAMLLAALLVGLIVSFRPDR